MHVNLEALVESATIEHPEDLRREVVFEMEEFENAKTKAEQIASLLCALRPILGYLHRINAPIEHLLDVAGKTPPEQLPEVVQHLLDLDKSASDLRALMTGCTAAPLRSALDELNRLTYGKGIDEAKSKEETASRL